MDFPVPPSYLPGSRVGHGVVWGVCGPVVLAAESLRGSEGAKQHSMICFCLGWAFANSKERWFTFLIHNAGPSVCCSSHGMDGPSIQELAGLCLNPEKYCSNGTNGYPIPWSTVCCSQDTESTLSLVETFAGQAEVTKAFRRSYLRSVRLDLEYMSPHDGHQNPMDLLSDAGFVPLGNDSWISLQYRANRFWWILISTNIRHSGNHPNNFILLLLISASTKTGGQGLPWHASFEEIRRGAGWHCLHLSALLGWQWIQGPVVDHPAVL